MSRQHEAVPWKFIGSLKMMTVFRIPYGWQDYVCRTCWPCWWCGVLNVSLGSVARVSDLGEEVAGVGKACGTVESSLSY